MYSDEFKLPPHFILFTFNNAKAVGCVNANCKLLTGHICLKGSSAKSVCCFIVVWVLGRHVFSIH